MALVATTDDVAALSAELAAFATANPAIMTTVLGIAARVVGSERWGDDAATGQALFAAHVLYSTQPELAGSSAAGGGPIASMSLGPASVSYAAAAVASDSELSTTRWGQLYALLRSKIRGRGVAILARRHRRPR